MSQNVKAGDIVCHRGKFKFKLIYKFLLPDDAPGIHGYIMERVGDGSGFHGSAMSLHDHFKHLINDVDFQAAILPLYSSPNSIEWEHCWALNDPNIYQIINGDDNEEDRGGLQYL